MQQAQECGEINPDLDPDAVVKAMLSWFQGLMLQKAWGEEVDVQEYISVIKAMLYGHFWVADAAPEGDPKKGQAVTCQSEKLAGMKISTRTNGG